MCPVTAVLLLVVYEPPHLYAGTLVTRTARRYFQSVVPVGQPDHMRDATTSATPILDLLAPLPKPVNNFALGPYLLPAVLIATVLAGRNYQLLLPLFGVWIVGLLATGIHELGHLIAGCTLGLRFQSVGIGPILIKRDCAKWAIEARQGFLDGVTSMSLDRVCRVRTRLIIFVAAGPAAGLALSVIGFVCLRIAIDRDHPALSLILAFLVGFSVLGIIASLIPARYRRYANDGMWLKVLLCSKEGTRQILATYALGMQYRSGIDQFCLNHRWAQVASTPGNPVVDPRFVAYTADWNAYQKAPSKETAAQFLERCLANSGFLSVESRDVLIANAAIFTAWQRNDSEKAQIWLDRLVNPERLHPLIRLSAEAALNCAQGQFDAALKRLELSLENVQHLSVPTARERAKAAMLDWYSQIELRREPQPASADS